MSGIGTGTAMLIGGLAAAGGSVAGAAMSSSAAKDAASTQSNAAKSAAQLQYEASQNSLDFQKQTWNTQQANEAPFLQTGQGAVTALGSLMQPGGQLSNNWTGNFTAPTAAQAEQTPGYKFAVDQGTQAMDRSAAASGNLLTGGTARAEQLFGQNAADTNYQSTYNNALNQYSTNYNTWNQNNTNLYNRLAGIAGTGQTASSNLNAAGTAASGQVSNTLLGTASAMGQDYQNAAAATASGYVGAANAYSSGLNGIGSNVSNYMLMSQLMNQNPYGSGAIGASGITQAQADAANLAIGG
jgi:hypothetical protein